MKLITNKDQSKEAAIFLLNKKYGDLKEFRHEMFSDSIFYYKPSNKETVMELELKPRDLWISYGEIWKFLETLFDYNYSECQKVIKIWVEESYNLKEVTPKYTWILKAWKAPKYL